MKKICSLALLVLGVAFVAGAGYSIVRGIDAKEQVRSELRAQKITTPPDAAVPGVAVDDARTAQAMGDIIDVHARNITGGRTYAEFGRYAAANGDPAGTDDDKKALLGPTGRPVSNPLRSVAFEASTLRTSLYTSVMAFNVADLVVGLGLMMAAIGAVLAGAGIALWRRPSTVAGHELVASSGAAAGRPWTVADPGSGGG